MSSAGKLVRFRQRRENFNRAFDFFLETFAATAPARIKDAAIIKSFEMVFELSWKALKDLLEHQGIVAAAPREILKEAFKVGLLTDGQGWIDLLDRRNRLTHVYSEIQAQEAVREISSSAVPLVNELYVRLNSSAVDQA